MCLEANYNGLVKSLAVLKDGRLASGTMDGKIKIWDWSLPDLVQREPDDARTTWSGQGTDVASLWNGSTWSDTGTVDIHNGATPR